MAKFFTYVIIMAGLMLLFNGAGLTTLTGKIFNFTIDNVAFFKSGWFWAGIIVLIGAFVATSRVNIGTLGIGISETSVRATFALGYLVLFLGDLISISYSAGQQSGVLGYMVGLIMIPIIWGYVLSMIDWIGGND